MSEWKEASSAPRPRPRHQVPLRLKPSHATPAPAPRRRLRRSEACAGDGEKRMRRSSSPWCRRSRPHPLCTTPERRSVGSSTIGALGTVLLLFLFSLRLIFPMEVVRTTGVVASLCVVLGFL